uniref:Innexin n=1 Tax=Strigamia maritima TaxID=126957 RepID=T1J585_STRMM
MSLLKSLPLTTVKKSVRIDNFIFHLHYRITAVLLTAASLLITSKEHFGKPINCGPPPPSLTQELIENFCRTRSTFTLVNSQFNDPHLGVNTVQEDTPIIYHKYYQWVWLVLSLQAAMFYFPHYVWKTIDNGRMSCMVKGLTNPLCDKKSMDAKIAILSQYVLRNWNKLNKWAYTYFMCEILNFLNVIGQIYMIDAFLGGGFMTYGLRVLEYGFLDEEYRNDSMVVVFPRVTKCSFQSFGMSGDVQVHDAICVLPLNVVNEKIYVVLWFWLVLLAVPSGFVLVYRSRRMYLMQAGVGDWLFLSLLGKNVDGLVLDMLLEEVEVQKSKSFHSIFIS